MRNFYHRKRRGTQRGNRAQGVENRSNPRLRAHYASFMLALCVFSLCVLCGSKSAAQKRTKPGKTVISPWDVEAREYLGTPQSEAAVKRGLDYLSTHQQPDGHWD